MTVLSFLCFGVLSLFVVEMTRRPLCIESRVVERIDRLSGAGADTIYRCAVNKQTPFSTYFSEQSRELTYRIQRTERLLESFEPFQRKVQLTIFEDRPFLFRVQGSHIYLGAKMLEAPGHLEKAMAKVWYRERMGALFAQQALMEEVFTDFLVYMDLGDLDIGDPNTHLKTSLRKVKWPFVLKSVPAYCDSPWKQSEHFAICKDKEDAKDMLQEKVVEMSLRPLLVTSWVRAYRDMTLAERYQFSRALPHFLRAEHTEPLPLVGAHYSGPMTTLAKAADAIKNVNLFVTKSKVIRDLESHRLFVANFTNELRGNGFQDAFAEASFDVLFVARGELTEKSATFQHFVRIAKSQPKLQIALRDDKNLWMLPARYPIALQSFGEIKAARTIVEKCGGYNFSYVMDYAEVTEKLLVVDHCDSKQELQFARFLKDGAEGFGAENKGVSFVQFHLPSLLMRKTELEQVSNVVEFIQKRDVESAPFKSLGWMEVQWSERAKAYKPKAFVDAIEWFRVPN